MAAPIPVKSQCLLLFAKKISQLYEMQQFIHGISYAIQWMMEPYWPVVDHVTRGCVTSSRFRQGNFFERCFNLSTQSLFSDSRICRKDFKTFSSSLKAWVKISQSVCHRQVFSAYSNICKQGYEPKKSHASELNFLTNVVLTLKKGATTLSITTFSIMAVSIKGLFETLSIIIL